MISSGVWSTKASDIKRVILSQITLIAFDLEIFVKRLVPFDQGRIWSTCNSVPAVLGGPTARPATKSISGKNSENLSI